MSEKVTPRLGAQFGALGLVDFGESRREPGFDGTFAKEVSTEGMNRPGEKALEVPSAS